MRNVNILIIINEIKIFFEVFVLKKGMSCFIQIRQCIYKNDQKNKKELYDQNIEIQVRRCGIEIKGILWRCVLNGKKGRKQ